MYKLNVKVIDTRNYIFFGFCTVGSSRKIEVKRKKIVCKKQQTILFIIHTDITLVFYSDSTIFIIYY